MQIMPYAPEGAAVGLSSAERELLQVVGRYRGNTYYVDSNASGDGTGLNWTDALTAIDAAINKCAADDRILVAPAHVDTVTAAAGIVFDVAGVTLIGLGNGDRRPQINFTTATGADVDITAAGVTIQNVRFTGGIDALTGPIDIDGADCTLIDCVTQDVTGQCVDFIALGTGADRCSIIRHTHRGATAAGADTWVTAVGCDDLVIQSPVVDGDFAVGCVELVTTACPRFKVFGGSGRPAYFHTRNSADIVFDDVVTGSTGDVGPHLYCMLADNAAGTLAEMTVAATGHFWDPIEMVNLAGEASVGTDITAVADS